jgi:hypothetical protein
LTKVQSALERAEIARSFLNSAALTEEAFGAAETEWIEAQADLSVEVELALGVPPQRLAELLS